jgi:hypothetical protein
MGRLGWIALFCLGCLESGAQESPDHSGRWTVSIGVAPVAGMSNFSWSIAGNAAGTNPNILSELHWNRLRSAGASVTGTLNIKQLLSVGLAYTHTTYYNGNVTDTDYTLDDRNGQVFYISLPVNDGYASRVGIRASTTLVQFRRLRIGLGATCTINSRYLVLRDKNQLNSNYHATWSGAGALAQADVKLIPGLELGVVLALSQVRYRADADWNLISEFNHPRSFAHRAKGYDYDGRASLTAALNRNLDAVFTAGGMQMATGTGTDRLYRSSGATTDTRLNEARAAGAYLQLGLLWTVSP